MSAPPRSFSISAIGRGFARLLSMGALAAAWVLLLLASLSVPTRNFTISTTTFADGAALSLGIFGSCYQPPKGDKQCTTAKVGYQVDITSLPNYGVNPGGGVNVTSSPLTGALVFFPLATAATAFTNFLSLIPVRSVTFMALGMTFLSIGATAISFVVALVVAVRASTVVNLSFNPTTFAVPIIGSCVWFACAALLAECGAFILLLIALEPANNSPRHSSSGENIYAASYDSSPYASDKKHLAPAPRDRRIEEDVESNSGRTRIARRLTPASQAPKYREDYEESVVRKPEKARKPPSQSSRRTVFADMDEDEEPPEETKSEVRSRKKSARSHQSMKERREADREEEDEGYIDFAGRRV